ncbi:unnamed protein product [Lactuca virosa]|uniref:Uncharacterized protein n=1 Tax=Lactuca virosa TaxID=75947 RepID=A0AAU9LI86_9ASTR|nr:unnamed protein product [Lactuca virosa]
MGCCLTTPATTNKTTHRRLDDSKSRIEEPATHATPSPPFEKESVKEVLSETPISISIPIIQTTTQILHENDAGKKSNLENQENVTEMSEMSEMCSYNESLSAATTSKAAMTDTERDVVEIEDDGQVTQKIITSPPPKKVPRKRPEKFTGEISKEKDGCIRPPPRRLVAPPRKKRNWFPSNTMPTTHRHGYVGPLDVVRRGLRLPGERSRSPAIRGLRLNMREGSPAPVKNSGDQIRVKSDDIERNVTVVMVGVPSELETSESLDNPVVSMECFIFL